MRTSEAAMTPDRIVAEMFQSPVRVRSVVRMLRWLPPSVTGHVLAALAVGDGIVRGGRFRRASAWAAAQGAIGWDIWCMAFALLANHGRFVAEEAMVGTWGAEDLRRRVVVEGSEHLRNASGGAILLGFHLGPPRAWFMLRALGYPVRFAGRLETAGQDPRWQEAFDAGDVIRLPPSAPSDRLQGLYRIRNLLRDAALVYLTADGPFGREAFRIDLPGGPLVVRTGWLALRRQTRVPVLPVLLHRDGVRRVIVVYPPLPGPADNPVDDAAMCRVVLTPLIEAYVRRFPTQCRYLALPRWSTVPVTQPPRGLWLPSSATGAELQANDRNHQGHQTGRA